MVVSREMIQSGVWKNRDLTVPEVELDGVTPWQVAVPVLVHMDSSRIPLCSLGNWRESSSFKTQPAWRKHEHYVWRLWQSQLQWFNMENSGRENWAKRGDREETERWKNKQQRLNDFTDKSSCEKLLLWQVTRPRLVLFYRKNKGRRGKAHDE